MKMLKKLPLIACMMFMLLFVFSCDNTEVAEPQVAKIEKLKNQLVEIMGFDPNTIVYNAKDKTFIAEGDRIFAASEIERYIVSNTISANGRTEHYRTKYLVDRTRVRDLKIAFDNNFLVGDWPSAAARAIELWNSIPNITIVHFRIVNVEQMPDITIHVEYNYRSLRTLGYSSGPSILGDGTPGHDINMNFAAWEANPSFNTDTQYKALAIAHEIGHTIGLGHTDGIGNNTPNAADIFINGTLTSDPNSIMNSAPPQSCAAFTQGDKDAIRILYPL